MIPFVFSECASLLQGDPSEAEWGRRLLLAAIKSAGADGGTLIWFEAMQEGLTLYRPRAGGDFLKHEFSAHASSEDPPFGAPVAFRVQLPMRTQDGVYGVIHLFQLNHEEPIAADQMAVLETFVSLVALILENKRTQGLLKRENDSLKRMDDRAADLVSELGRKSVDLEDALRSLVNRERLAVLGQIAAAVAHQIRNPLSVIGAHVELMMGELAEGEKHYAALETISRKVSQTESTIHELMELARPLSLELMPCSLTERLENVARFVAPNCKLQGVEMKVIGEESLPAVWLDATQFERCLLDLAINALQQMPSGGVLEMGCSRNSDAEILLWVADTGAGVRPEHSQRIFEPFFSQRPGGTGLGLYNVRRICQEMGIEISVENIGPTPESQGARFKLSLPLGDEKPSPIYSTPPFSDRNGVLH